MLVRSTARLRRLGLVGSAPRLLALAALVLLSACLGGGEEFTHPSVPITNADAVEGIANARFVFDADGRSNWDKEVVAAWARRVAYLHSTGLRDWSETALALSGGGQDGAFGAGLLVGWSERGDRPEFDYVTGVSTGALISPFAFLGREYDEKLRDLFTTVDEDALLSRRWFTAALTDDALYDTAKLFARIQAAVDDKMVADIAREYRRGRLLLVASTNIVAGRGVAWNIGAIAASGHANARDLIHKVLLASASIPTLFPPVVLHVTAGGHEVEELHVDGGTTIGEFLYSPTLHVRELPRPQGHDNRISAYMIRNGRLRPNAHPVKREALDIAQRALTTLIASQGLGDIFRGYELAKRDRFDLKYAAVERDFPLEPENLFDRAYMNALFEYGRRAGRSGAEWHSQPPGFER